MIARLAVLLALALAVVAPSAALAQGNATTRAPSLGAPQAILVEPATGDVVFDRRATDSRPIASTTKLMTALLTLERVSLDDTMAAIDYRASPAESQCGLRAGEKLTVRDHLRCLLVASGNDAAATLAVRIAGSREAFVRLMNQRAKELGLVGTHYADPIGLSPEDRSTATDLVKLALVLRTKPFFRETVDQARVTLRSGAHPRTLLNRNMLVRHVPVVNGIKTGHTARAGYVLVGSATRNGVTVLSAVLGTPSEAARDADSLALLRYGLRRYHMVRPVARGQRVGEAALRYRDEQVALVAQRAVERVARRGEQLRVRTVQAPSELDGPLPQGAEVGTIEVLQRGKVVARVPLVTAHAVSAASATERLKDFTGRRGTVVLLLTFVACSLLLMLLRRRAVRRRQEGGARTGDTEIA